jgi:Zn-dependent protease/CBS domain-containing protein
MFGRRIELFKVFGFQISIDLSWFVIAALITFSLARQYFPVTHAGLPVATYWAMGVAGALGLFVSVVAHELSHALVARRYGLQMKGITLFIFGGVAEMTGEPANPKTEFLMAIAGPIASFGVAAVFLGLRLGLPGLPVAVAAVLGTLSWWNFSLGLFNLVPAFPLDGGRVLRSVLWEWKGNLRWATRVTSRLGSGFGILLMVGGAVLVLNGNWGGIWLVLVGMFVRNAAQMSYQQLLLRRALEGEPVARFMKADPVTVPRGISVAELVERYVYRYHFKLYPVLDDAGRLIGCVTTRQVRELPREEWDRTTVGALARGCQPENTVGPATDAMQALSAMNRNGVSRLMVVDGDRLLGVLTLKDLLRFFSLKMELEETA